MNREDMTDFVKRIYSARRTGDVDAILKMFAPDAVFRMAGAEHASKVAGIAKGHEAIRGAVGGLIDTFEEKERTYVSILCDGDRAVVHSKVHFVHVPDGKPIEIELLDLWRFKDGKVVEMVEFLDTAHVNLVTGQ